MKPPIAWRAEDLVRITGGQLRNLPLATPVRGFALDSREVQPGQVFVALQGTRFHGVRFAQEAVARGATVVLTDRPPAPQTLPYLLVPDTQQALLDLARVARMRLQARVIGITGSVGKTTTKDLLAHLLSLRYRVQKAPKSFNNFIGLPLTLLNAAEDTEVLILELGTNHPGEMNPLAAIARPHLALITAIAEAHLGFFGSLEAIAREKAALLYHTWPGPAFVNETLAPYLDLFHQVLPEGVDLVPYGPRSQQVRIQRLGLLENRWKWQGEEWISRPGGPGPLYNTLGALAVAQHLGLDPKQLSRALASFHPPAMRMEVFQQGNVTVVNDAYNANPASMENLLETLKPQHSRVLLVLGDMLELGAFSEALHRQVARRAYEMGFRRLVAVGQEARFYVEELRNRPMELLVHSNTPAEAAEAVRRALRPGDILALKASRAVALETLLPLVLTPEPQEVP